MKIIFFIFALFSFSFSSLSLSEIKNMPKSFQRDYFIYTYLRKKNISTQDAHKAFTLSSSDNYKIKREYKKHLSKQKNNTSYAKDCKQTRLDKINNVDCLLESISIKKLFKVIK